MTRRPIRYSPMAILVSAMAFSGLSCGAGRKADLVIYGGTSSGLAAAIQASRMGKSVIVLEPGTHLGGLTAGGLSWTGIGNKVVIGGIAREFYQRIKKKYEDPKFWTSETRDQYFERRRGSNAKNEDAIWTFEPKVASAVYREMLAEAGVKVITNARLDLAPAKSVVKKDGRIVAIVLEGGLKYEGRVFIDATYEGDLMAKAGVSYTIGRESNAKYDETWNGSQAAHVHGHQFPNAANVDPYVIPGKPGSGLLPIIDPTGPGVEGVGDNRIQAYCFRMCLASDPNNRIAIAKPEGYDEKDHELLLRFAETGKYHNPASKYDPIPNLKAGTNNHGAVSTDYMGANWDYPEADCATRDKILKRHEVYQRGYMWTLQNHSRIPEKIRAYYRQWGFPKDEFTNNGGWPTQLYIREARRLIGAEVMTEHHVMARKIAADSVGMIAYGMDSHNVQRYVTKEGFVRNEGNVQVGGFPPYPISYLSIVPRKGEASNLLVPVCMSATHIAYGSIRMEPVFMVLGQSAATAAVMANDGKVAVQVPDCAKLRQRLLADKQVLEAPAALSKGDIDPAQLEGLVMDSRFAHLSPAWKGAGADRPRLGPSYFHDLDARDGRATAQFTVKMPQAERFRVKLLFPPKPDRATTNVPVVISGGGNTYTTTVNQRQPADWIGVHDLPAEFTVTVSNKAANGMVVIDGLQVLPSPNQ